MRRARKLGIGALELEACTLSIMSHGTKPKAIEPERIALLDADVRLWRAAWDDVEAPRVLDDLLKTVDWQHEEIVIFGRRQRVPRLVAWHGDPDAAYVYSGTMHEPRAWTPLLQAIRNRVQALTGQAFNSVLLNRYRDGRDGMGWHADDEPELGRNPAVASVSFGAMRRFQLRHRRRRLEKTTIKLGNGDLLLMAGATQHHYVHAVPKTAQPVGERINLTFRLVYPRQ
jgi:alkylated DNA repair dioxygenase AlkB